MDYLHIVNWRKAEQLVKAGKFVTVNGMKVIPLKVAAEEGILFFAPEPKSPHGVDVCPCGNHIVVGGKLDPHVTVYSMRKILDAIRRKDFEGRDPYGVPILRFDAVKEAQVEVGLGPLHTQWDNQGYAYTSLFLDSAVARWTMGDCKFKAPEKAWTLVQKNSRPLQCRSHRCRSRRHGKSSRQVVGGVEQMDGGQLRQCRSVAASDLPTH
jgi:nitrous-oxide reductase